MDYDIFSFFNNFSDYELDEVLSKLKESFEYIMLGFGIVLLIAGICWVLSCIGLYKVLKKNKENNAWLAFVPFANKYMFAKLGYEVYEKTQYDYLKYVVLVLSIALSFFIKKNTMNNLYSFVNLGIKVIEIGAAYNIFKKNFPNDYVFKIILYFFFGNLILLFMHNSIKPASELKASKNKETEEEKEVIVEKVEETKTSSKSACSFCRHCGAPVGKSDKFCSGCGKEIK